MLFTEKSFSELQWLVANKGGMLPTGNIIEEYISRVTQSSNVAGENILSDIIKLNIGYSIKSQKQIERCIKKPKSVDYHFFDINMNYMPEFIGGLTYFKLKKNFFMIETRPRGVTIQDGIVNLEENFKFACESKKLTNIRSLTYLYSPIFVKDNKKFVAILLIDTDYEIYYNESNYKLNKFNISSKVLAKEYFVKDVFGRAIVPLKEKEMPPNPRELLDAEGGKSYLGLQ